VFGGGGGGGVAESSCRPPPSGVHTLEGEGPHHKHNHVTGPLILCEKGKHFGRWIRARNCKRQHQHVRNVLFCLGLEIFTAGIGGIGRVRGGEGDQKRGEVRVWRGLRNQRAKEWRCESALLCASGIGMGGGGRFHPHTSALDFDFEFGLICIGILDLEPVVMYCYPLWNCVNVQ
jgi:hypothetical protein